ncbi:MAG: hypothetical protein C4589_11280 [Peptococcaceae bacterium]|nr:MAG: hypothetical protein C4589_11280 [Peptococcaceae bacterium]
MPRSKVVTINGKQITVKEHKIKELREEVIPKLSIVMDAQELAGKGIKDMVPVFEAKIAELFPEVTEADVDESYPSEVEALIEAWVEVNFTGLKKIYKPLLSLAQMGIAK